MCVAIPGRVKSIDSGRATVDFEGNCVKARIGLLPVKVGDHVLVHAGMIIQILRGEEADELASLFAELEEITNGNE